MSKINNGGGADFMDFDELENKKTRRTRISSKTNLLEMEAVNYQVQDIDKPTCSASSSNMLRFLR